MAEFDVEKIIDLKIVVVDSDGKRWELKPSNVTTSVEWEIGYILASRMYRYVINGPFTMPKEDFPGSAIPKK